jgi:hypothetical protein
VSALLLVAHWDDVHQLTATQAVVGPTFNYAEVIMSWCTEERMMKSQWQNEAWRRWPEAAWIEGDGRFAFVTYCRDAAVTLWPTEEDAQAEKAKLDGWGSCGGRCWKDHVIIDLESERPKRAARPLARGRRASKKNAVGGRRRGRPAL